MRAEQLLASLAAMSARVEGAERRILDAAVARLDEVNARLEAIRPDAHLHAGDEYQALVVERGHLHRVIAQAQQNGARLK